MDQSIFDTRGLDNRSKLFYLLHEQEVVLMLAFIGGYVDVAGYIKLCGLFTSSITGNFVAALASVTHSNGLATRIFVCIFFTLGGIISMLISNKIKRNGLYNPFYYILNKADPKKMKLIKEMNSTKSEKKTIEKKKVADDEISDLENFTEDEDGEYTEMYRYNQRVDSVTNPISIFDIIYYNLLEYLPTKSRYYLGHGSLSAILFFLEAFFIFFTMFLGLCSFPDGSDGESLEDSKVFFVAIFMGFSMGIHNAAAKECLPWIPATTVLTMTTVSISIYLGNMASSILAYYGVIDFYSKNPNYGLKSTHEFKLEEGKAKEEPSSEDEALDEVSSEDEENIVATVDTTKFKEEMMDMFWDNWTKFERTFRPMAAFLLGALIGALLMDACSYWGLLLPFFFCSFIIYDLYLRIYYENHKDDEIDQPKVVQNISKAVTITPFSNINNNNNKINEIIDEIELDEEEIDQEIQRNDKIIQEIKKDLNNNSV